MIKMKSIDNFKCWWGYGVRRFLYIVSGKEKGCNYWKSWIVFYKVN